MSAPKPAASKPSGRPTRRFSLVSIEAQRAIHQALCNLPSSADAARGTEIAEVAACLAAGEDVPVILARDAPGARTVRQDVVCVRSSRHRFTAAVLAAIDAMLHRPDAPAAIVCAGKLDSATEARQDWRAALGFAARHKLPILFLVANRLSPRQSSPSDLRTLYPEFGLPVFTVDANDAIAAYRVATEALHQIRHHRGPSLLEAFSVPAAHQGAEHTPLQIVTAYMRRHGHPLP